MPKTDSYEYCERFSSDTEDRRTLFSDYITYGAMPGIFMFEKGSGEQREYVKSVYKTILEKDILRRNSAAGRQLAESLLDFVIYNIGCLTSVKKISDTLKSNGVSAAYNTVDAYFDTLQDCYLIYKADRYDVVGKEYLKLINKYYVADFGFRYYLLNNRAVELSQILENLVFLELKRRRFQVATCKVEDKEVDFIVKDTNGTLKYIQVAVTVADKEKLMQELRPFREIKDNYPKYIITLDEFFAPDHDGIRTINALDFLLGQEL